MSIHKGISPTINSGRSSGLLKIFLYVLLIKNISTGSGQNYTRLHGYKKFLQEEQENRSVLHEMILAGNYGQLWASLPASPVLRSTKWARKRQFRTIYHRWTYNSIQISFGLMLSLAKIPRVI